MKYLILAFLLSACGPAAHLRIAERHINKAKDKGAKVSVDTVYVTKEVIVPETRFDTVLRRVNFRDTITLVKDKVTFRLKIDTVNNSIFIDHVIKADTVRVMVKVPCETVAAKGWHWWWLLVAALVGGIITLLFKK